MNANAPKVSLRRRRSLDRRVMDAVGREWFGSAGPPLGNRKLYVHDDGVTRVFSMQDDGGFVGIGYPDEWHVIMRTKAARMFAWWTLRVWLADWCGLRSTVYYRALFRNVDGRWYVRRPYPDSDRLTRRSSYDVWLAEQGDQ